MAINHLETVAGGANITGDPAPISPRSAPQQKADQSRQLNHRPTPASKAAGAAQAMKGAPKKADKPPDKKPSETANPNTKSPDMAMDTPPPKPQGNPILPIDWKAKAAEDPWAVHQHGQYVASVLGSLLNIKAVTEGIPQTQEGLTYLGGVYNAAADPAAIGQSVKNIWDQNTAQSIVTKWALEGMVQAFPPAALARDLDKQFGGASDQQALADVVGQGLPMTANPINAAAPEKIAAQAALYAGPSVAQALAAPNPNDQTSGLVWSAATAGLLSLGHLGSFKGVLSKALGRWPELEKALDAVVEGRKASQAKIQDPSQDHRLDWVAESLRKPVFAGSTTTKAAAATGKQIIEREPFGASGQFRDVNVTAARTKAALKSVDAESRSQVEEAIAAGRFSTQKADALLKNWTEMGFQYPLDVVTRADSVPVNPLPILQAAAPEVRAKGMRAATAMNGYLNQMKSGLSINRRNEGTQITSLWRSLTGHAEGTDASDREGVAAMLDLAGHLDGNLLTKAIEGDRATFDALPHEGQIYVAYWRLLSNEQRLARQHAGIDNAVGDRIWRVPKRAPNAARGAGGGGVLTTEAERSRALAPTLVADAEGQTKIALTQAHATVSDANSAIARQRAAALEHLKEWATPLSKEFVDKPEARAIRKLAETDVPAAEQRAKDYVNAIYRDFETNSHRILARGGFGHQIKAIHSMQAVKELEGMTLKVPNPDKKGAEMVAQAAVRVTGMEQRDVALLRDQGYRPMDQGHFNDVLVHKEMADLLDQSRKHADRGRGPAMEAALKAEGLALKLIMYNPAVHGWNVASRMLTHAGMQAVTDPVGLFSHALAGGNTPAMRQEAINAGVQNHARYNNFLPDVYKRIADATGEHDLFDLPLEGQVKNHSPEMASLAGLGKPSGNFYNKAQNLLWVMADDFAVSAYHIEKHSAMAWPALMNEAEASAHAARRANSWAGYVAGEDAKPMWHDAARLVMFAPSFWRTWGEIFLPYYKNAGVGGRQQALQMAKQELPLIAATVATAYVSGNLMNIMLSGQMQDKNQPQNRMKLEVRNPQMIRALQSAKYPGADKIDPDTGYGKNGEVLALDNPLGRFQKDIAGATGLTSGHPDYKLSDTEDGLAQFMMNRTSPFLGATMAFGNLDLYQSIKDHQARAIDRSDTVGHPTLASSVSALFYMAPNGSNLVKQIMSNQPASGMTLPGGAQVSPGVVKGAAALGNTSESLIWQLLTGTTGPYTTAEKTRGQTPSDDEYRKYDEIKKTYETKVQHLDAEMAGGTLKPSDWLAAYRKEHGSYIDQTGAFFLNAPEFAHGPTALTASWGKLYKKAENPDGTLDPSALAGLQAEWKQNHSPADYQAVQGQLSKNDRKYPMVGLYHKTIASYTKWQEEWAQKNGIDVNQLRADVRAYGAAYNDKAKSAEILRTHHEVALYERAKKTEFEHSPAGLLYGLYYSSATVANYMRAYHLTAQEVIQQEEAAP